MGGELERGLTVADVLACFVKKPSKARAIREQASTTLVVLPGPSFLSTLPLADGLTGGHGEPNKGATYLRSSRLCIRQSVDQMVVC